MSSLLSLFFVGVDVTFVLAANGSDNGVSIFERFGSYLKFLLRFGGDFCCSLWFGVILSMVDLFSSFGLVTFL